MAVGKKCDCCGSMFSVAESIAFKTHYCNTCIRTGAADKFIKDQQAKDLVTSKPKKAQE